MSVKVQVKQLPHAKGLSLPAYKTDLAAGADVVAAVPRGNPMKIYTGERAAVPTGLTVAIPEGYEIQVRPRSGLAKTHGIQLVNAPGTIDADFRGEIQVLLINMGTEPFVIERGDRIAQLVLSEVPQIAWDEVDELPDTARGAGGFGSTGTS